MVKSLPRTTGRCLVAFAPCGCWQAVQVEYADLGEQAKAAAEFLRDASRSGAERVDTMPSDEFKALRNNQGEGYDWDCPHDPKWGGAVSTHAECPRCYKSVKKKKDGTLAAHKEIGRWTCSQVPYERTAS